VTVITFCRFRPLSCRSCQPNAPFAELVQLSRLSVTDEWNVERGRAVLGE
jgi:hypothetical protein